MLLMYIAQTTKLEETNIQWDAPLNLVSHPTTDLARLNVVSIRQLSMLNLMCYKGCIKKMIWLTMTQYDPRLTCDPTK